MYKNNKICVVVPAYNEEKFVNQVIKTIPEFVDHVIVVDDASTDNTFEVASDINDPRVFIIRHKVNQGVGGSIISGHKKALGYNADIAVVMAGDGQMDPKYLSNLLDPIIEEGYHYTKGNRFFKKNALKGMPKLRVVGNLMLTFMTKLSSGYWNIFDPQNGYTAIKCDVLKELELDGIANRYDFENDMLINLNIGNYRVKDVWIPARYSNEKSKIKLYTFIPKTLLRLLKGFNKRILVKYVIRDFHPIALFLMTGFTLFALGLLFGIYLVYESIGPPTASTGTIMLSVLPLFFGFQLILAGLVMDIINTPK